VSVAGIVAALTLATATATASAASEPTAAESVQCSANVEVAADRGRILIHVLDANSQVRLPAAKLFINGDAGGREFETDQLGSRQIDGVPPGDYLVLADADPGSDQLMISLPPGHQCEIIFRLGDVVMPEQLEDEQDETTIQARARQREQGNTLRGTGIGVLTLGGALIAGSVISALLSTCTPDGEAAGDCNDNVRRNLAIGFGVSGGLAAVGGITMIVVGKKRSRGATAAFLPTVSPTRGGANFGFAGRF
jgi:hypothetical protein